MYRNTFEGDKRVASIYSFYERAHEVLEGQKDIQNISKQEARRKLLIDHPEERIRVDTIPLSKFCRTSILNVVHTHRLQEIKRSKGLISMVR